MQKSGQSIAVIGAGLVGAACALHLQRDGQRVTLFDPQDMPHAASSGNAGLLSSGGVVPIAMPGLAKRLPRLLSRSRGPLVIRPGYLSQVAGYLLKMAWASRTARVESIARALAMLLRPAADCYRDLIGTEAFAHAFANRGLLYTYGSSASFASASAALALRARHDIAFEVCDGKQARALEPSLTDGVMHGVHYPRTHHALNPAELNRSLIAAYAGAGGVLRRDTVDSITPADDKQIVLAAGGHMHPFDRAVLAAGAWSARLLQPLGLRVPLDTERGYHAMLPTPGISMRVPVIADSDIAVIPMNAGIRVTGMMEFAGIDAPPDYRLAEHLLSLVQPLLPGIDVTGATFWMGFRPSLPDTLPLIGPVPGCERLLLAFGHGHLGVTHAAVTGRLIADLIASREPVVDPAPYSLQRFLSGGLRRYRVPSNLKSVAQNS